MKITTLSWEDMLKFNYWWASHCELNFTEALDLFKKERGIK